MPIRRKQRKVSQSALPTTEAPVPASLFRYSTSDLQTRFGAVMERVVTSEGVVISRHNRDQFVILSVARYAELAGAESKALAELEAEFDAEYVQMQDPAVWARTMAAFKKPLGDVAPPYARSRPKARRPKSRDR